MILKCFQYQSVESLVQVSACVYHVMVNMINTSDSPFCESICSVFCNKRMIMFDVHIKCLLVDSRKREK